MWNPFKAIASGIANAGKAIAKAPGAAIRAVKAPFTKEKAPKAPPATKAPTKAPPAPKTQTRATIPVEKPPAPTTGKVLPPSMVKGGGRTGGGMARDEGILGADSDQIRDLNEAVKEFEAEGNLLGLNGKALDFINHPSYAAIFDKYTTGSGFSTEQWTAGMKEPHNFRITRTGDKIEIIFDADYEIDDYDLGGRSASATF